MNSKSKNNNFTNSKGLTREEIDSYKKSSNEKVKHSIEKKALENSFDSDSLDGWSESSMGTSSMKALDKKFTGNKFSNQFKIASSIIGISLLILLFTYYSKNEITPKSTVSISKTELKIYEKTDLITPEKIEDLKEIPKKDQIHVKTIQNDYQIKEELKSIVLEKEKINVDQLPIKEIQEDKPKENAIITKSQLFGKEIYLEDLKLIDYRNYRSRPTIKTKQIELIGTPASLEDKTSKEEEITNWKTIEIPYIEYIDKTMDVFAKGNLKKALTRFEVILTSYPTDINSNFYGGLCYFNLGQYDKTILSMEACLNSEFNNFNEEAEWYLAKSYQAKGDYEKAKILFKEISEKNGFYAKQASKH